MLTNSFHFNKLTTEKNEFSRFSNQKSINLKRNFIFVNDLKLFFTCFCLFMKRVRKFLSKFKSFLQYEDFQTKEDKLKIGFIKKFRANFFFIAGIHDRDTFFFQLFTTIASYYDNKSFFIAWDPSKFFYFLRKKRRADLSFFPIIIVSPNLYYNDEFMHALKAFKAFPIIFFFDRQTAVSQRILNYKNVFSIFLNKKNNLGLLFSFLRLFLFYF